MEPKIFVEIKGRINIGGHQIFEFSVTKFIDFNSKMQRTAGFMTKFMENDTFLTNSHDTDRVIAWFRERNLFLRAENFQCNVCGSEMKQADCTRIEGCRMKCTVIL